MEDEAPHLDPTSHSTLQGTSVQTSPVRSSTSYVQTCQMLSSHTPRKVKLRNMNKNLQTEINELKRQNNELKQQNWELKKQLEHSYVTLDQLQILVSKIWPSIELAEFINVQIKQAHNSPKGRRYTNEFKNKCLSIFFLDLKYIKIF